MKLTNKQIIAIIAIIFGILVLILPDFLNYLIALFLIVYGIISLIPSKKKTKK
jgi:predicted membrane protein